MTQEAHQHEGRRFHLLEVIGAGAFGEVYLAEQDSGAGFRRKVAIKLLHPDVEKIPDAGRRMRDEARILGLLSHRHIVTVLDLVKLGERWAVIMDYVPGADLEEVAKALQAQGEAFPPGAALEAGSAVLRALAAAYTADDGQGGELQVVHRDIKPSNVRVTDDGDLKVLDFGVARVELDSREAQTKATGWMGTERYMSPERILFEGDTPAGDTYAVGATIAELLLGEPLGRTPVLPERHEPFVEERMARLRVAVADLGDDLADELVAALASSLAAEPGDRPSAADLADTFDALARRCGGESLGAFCRRFVPTVPRVLGRKAEPATGILSEVQATQSNATFLLQGTQGSQVPLPSHSLPPPRRRSPVLIAFAALLLAAGVTVAIGVAALGGVAAALAWVGVEPEPQQQTAEAPDPAAQPAPAPVAPAPVDPAPVAPAPVTEPEPQPAAGAPEPAPTQPPPAPAAPPHPPAPRPPGAPPAAVDPDAPRLDRAQVALANASSLELTCGDRSARGTASVRITDFPAGACTVRAVYLGTTYTTTVTFDRVRGSTCTITDDTLTCP